MIIIVFGLPGSGKSFFASKLSKKMGAIHLNSDELRFTLLKHPTYEEREKMKVYRRLLAITKVLLLEGRTVIVDATFYKQSLRQKFANLATELKTKIAFIEVVATEDIIKPRITIKRKDSDADYKVYLKIKKDFESMTDDHLILNSAQNNIAEMVENAENYLG